MSLKKIPIGVGFPISEGVEYINKAIEAAGRSDVNASEALTTANQAKSTADNTKAEFDQIVIDGDSSVEAAQARVDADGTSYATLKERLDVEHNEVSSQLAQTETQLNTKMDKGTTDISVAQINKNKGKLNQTYMTDEFLQQMAGNTPISSVPADRSITSEKLAKNSVTPTETSFFKKTKNLFNGIYHDLLLQGSDTVKALVKRNDPTYTGSLAFVEVEPNTDYTIKVFDENLSNVFRLTQSAININELSYTDDVAKLDKFLTILHEDKYMTLTTDPDTKYLYIYVSNSGSRPRMQVEEGSVATPYASNFVIDTEAVGFESIEYKNKTKTGDGGFIVSPYGSINIDTNEKKITVPRGTSVWTGQKWIRITPAGSAGTPPTDFLISPDLSNGYNFIYFNINSENDNPEFLLRKYNANNSDLENYILIGMWTFDGGYLIGNHTVNGKAPISNNSVSENMLENTVINKLNNADSDGGKFMYYMDLQGKYARPTTGLESVAKGTMIDLESQPKEYIYGLFDDLMAQYPEYISKRVIGYATGLDGGQDLNMPIYEYAFKPVRTEERNGSYVPKMLIQACIHGNEKIATWSVYQFLKQMLETSDTDEQMEFFRYSIDLLVVPIASPYGWDNNRRHTINDVDPNTNFSTDWTSRTPNDPYYSGSIWGGYEPMTEQETITLDAWYAENQDAIGMFDVHNTFTTDTTNQGKVSFCWLISSDKKVRTMARSVLDKQSREWRKEFTDLQTLPKETKFGYVSERTDGTARNQALKKYGIKSLTVDPAWNIDLFAVHQKFDENVVKVNLDAFGACMVGFVKNLGK